MKKKIRLKRKYYIKIKNKIAIIIIIIAFFVFFFLYNIAKKITPIIMNYGEMEADKIANLIISKSISKNDLEKLAIEDLFIINKDKNNEIISIDFNTISVNKIIFDVTTKIQQNIKYIENGEIDKIDYKDELISNYNIDKIGHGIFYKIPLGVVLNNSLFSNIGPKIPIKFYLIGNIVGSLENKIKNYGINNALVEIRIKLTLTEKIVLPFNSKIIKIDSELPIAIKMIQGKIPSYYFNNLQSSDSIKIPIQ